MSRCCGPNAPFEEVVRCFSTTRTPCLYVVDAERRLCGVIELHAIKDILGTQDVSNVVIAQDMAEPARSVPADASLATVSEKLWFLDTGEAPVVDGAEGHFLGVVTQRDLLGFLDREILRRNLLLSEVRWRDGFNKGIDSSSCRKGFRLESLEVPPDLVGMTVEQAQLRSRHGLNVIAIANVDAVGNERRYPPAPGYRLATNDKLVVVASSEDLEAFSRLRTAVLEAARTRSARPWPLWSAAPFVGLLLSIAFLPLAATAVVAPPLSEDHARMGAALRGAVRLRRAWRQPAGIAHTLVLDYTPVRAAARDAVHDLGGIVVRGTLRGTPGTNVRLLAIGTGWRRASARRGACMLLIRPLLRANALRQHRSTSSSSSFSWSATSAGR
jgi:hypothetical protein